MTRMVYMPGVCRECGCTDERACIDALGNACFWAEPDLCSACSDDADDFADDDDFEDLDGVL